jgi:hypothetical protein
MKHGKRGSRIMTEREYLFRVDDVDEDWWVMAAIGWQCAALTRLRAASTLPCMKACVNHFSLRSDRQS